MVTFPPNKLAFSSLCHPVSLVIATFSKYKRPQFSLPLLTALLVASNVDPNYPKQMVDMAHSCLFSLLYRLACHVLRITGCKYASAPFEESQPPSLVLWNAATWECLCLLAILMSSLRALALRPRCLFPAFFSFAVVRQTSRNRV